MYRKKVNLTKLWWRKDYAGVIKVLKHPKSFQFDVNAKDSLGYTPLMLAVWDNKVRVVKLLLKHPKINVNATNKYGWSAFLFSLYSRSPRIAKLLLAHPKLDVHSRLAQVMATPLIILVGSNSHPRRSLKIIKKLLRHPKFDFSREDIKRTAAYALNSAVSHGNLLPLEFLLKQPEFVASLPKSFFDSVAAIASFSLPFKVERLVKQRLLNEKI